MAWTLPAGWLAAMRRSGARPVVIARLTTQPWASLDVLNWTLAEVNPSIADTITVGTVTISAGTDFLAVGSNATTAANIANAFNAEATAVGAAMWARAIGTRVFFIQRDYTGNYAGGTISNWALGVQIRDYQGNPISDWAAVHADGEPVFHYFVSGPDPLFGYMPHIDRISPLEWEIDPVDRSFNMSGVDIYFGQRGQYIRRLMLFHDLISVPVSLWLGTSDLPEASFLQLPTMLIQDIETDDVGNVMIKCRGADALFMGAKISNAAFVADHPLHVVEAALVAGGVTNSTTYPNLPTSVFDFTTLNPANYPDKGHFNVSRYDAWESTISPDMRNRITRPESVWNIMQDMAMLMYGGFMPNNVGVWRYVDYDPDAIPIYTFNAGSQDSSNPGNYCRITGNKVGGTNAITELEWEFQGVGKVGNESSIVVRRFAFNQNFTHRQTRKTSMNSAWLNGVFRFLNNPIPLPDTANGGTATKSGWEARSISYGYFGTTNLGSGLYDNTESFQTNGAGRQGLCGARWVYNSTTGNLDRVPESRLEGDTGGAGSGRRAFVMFVGPGGWNQGSNPVPFNDVEIMAINRLELSFPGSTTVTASTLDDPNVYQDLRYSQGHTEERVPHPYIVRLYIDSTYTQAGFDGFTNGRGGYGTSIPNQWGSQSAVSGGAGPSVPDVPYIVDVTIPMVVSDIILDRFKYGAPEVTFQTPLHEIDKEPCDFVRIVGAENYLGYTSDGSSLAQVFEITRKKVDIFGENPRIEWEAVLVRNDTLPPAIDVLGPNWPGVTVGVTINPPVDDDPITDNAGNNVEIDTNGDGIDDEFVYRG